LTQPPTQPPALLICSYQPKPGLLQLIMELKAKGFNNIIVVDDGSKRELGWIFQQLIKEYGVTLLTNDVNQGKGHALKKGFKYILEKTTHQTVVCADADGQHKPEDIYKVANETKEPKTLVLGCRVISQEVPLRNRFGNLFTRRVFKLLSGHSLTDTQTGLRGLHRNDLSQFLDIQQNRYDFETKQLLKALKLGLKIKEVPIQTVYHQERDSHFRSVVDSTKVLAALFGLR